MNTLTIGNEIMIQNRRSLFSVLLRSTLLTAALVSTQTAFGQKLSPDKERELIAVLRSNAADNEKGMTCKNLAVEGSGAAVQDLASLLKDEKLASWA
ncbi:MAG: hypothetical protein K9M08_15550, partial [Pirellula sp.]|nr:hypothetical protein [Pirellula sp.]